MATVGRNRLARKSKRRRLDNEDVSVGIVDRRDKRDVGVPGGDGDTTIGCERGDGELDRRRLAVGAGDGDDRPIVPDRCEIKLGHDRHTGGVGDGERLVLLRRPGVGTTNAAAATRSVSSSLDPSVMPSASASARSSSDGLSSTATTV